MKHVIPEAASQAPETERLLHIAAIAGHFAIGGYHGAPAGHNTEDLPAEYAQVEPRSYQLEAWAAIAEARASGADRALIHLATGLGKTTVAVVDALRFMATLPETSESSRPPKILFACHQNEILEQAAGRFKTLAPTIEQGYFRGGRRAKDSSITFATMQSLYQNLDTIAPDEFDYIIYDEAHHSQAKTFSEVISHFQPRFQLALTATPDRMDQNDIRDLFGSEVYKKTLEEAMLEGWLADVDYHLVLDDAVKEALAADFNPNTLKELYELFDNESRNEAIADQISKEIERIGLQKAKTIVFCQNIQQANEMAALLNGEPFHSGVNAEDRKRILDSFRTNGTDLITTRDMFNEGMDVPEASLIVFLRSTGSKTIFEQQLGRGLRRHDNKQKVTVLDFVANIERLALVKELSDKINDLAADQRPDNSDGEDVSDDNRIGGSTDQSSAFRFRHGDFDFDKVAVDLFTKYSLLTKNAGPAPEDWRYAGQIAEKYGLQRQTILKISDEIGIARTIMIGQSGHRGVYYSPEDITIIEAKLATFVSPPEGWMTQTGIKKMYGIKSVALATIVKQLEVPGATFRSKTGQGFYYSPDSIEAIVKQANRYEKAPEDWLSITAFAKELGTISQPGLVALAGRLGISGTIMSGQSNKKATYLSPEEQKIIIDSLVIPAAPVDWVSFTNATNNSGIGGKTLLKILETTGDTFVPMTRNGRGGLFISPESLEKALNVYAELPKPQEFDISFEALSGTIYGKAKALKELMISTGITGRSMISKNGIEGIYFTPEEIKIITDNAPSGAPLAPEGYLSVYQCAVKYGKKQSTLNKLMKEKEISGSTMRNPSGRAGIFLSEAEVIRLLGN